MAGAGGCRGGGTGETVDRLPIIYIRGYAGPTAGINRQADDPFYGFNEGATHVRVGGDGDPMFYQFEGPMLRLMIDEGYQLLVRGDQKAFLADSQDGTVPKGSLWVYRFYDQAATTFVAPPHRGLADWVSTKLHSLVSADGFDIEAAARGLYDLIQLVRLKTGADKVHLVAHSMGGLVARCMMQKVCFLEGRQAAKALVAKLFTYGTPHGGVPFELGALDWLEETFGPCGSDIFAPAKMYGYLTPDAAFGQEAPEGSGWDPQYLSEEVFPPSDIFCLIGTDPADYGLSKAVVGPKSDGLVRIEHAYVRHAHRAYVYKSHSGRYGEVNSEEGYQNLRRFLFGKWAVSVTFDGLPAYPRDMDQQPPAERWPIWQADMRLAIRGLPVVISEQQAAHWCPIQINHELSRHVDTPDAPVPLVTTFLLDPADALDRPGAAAIVHVRHESRMRYVLSLRVYKLVERDGAFRFAEHLEQVPDWADALVVDVGPDVERGGLAAWAAWSSEVPGSMDDSDPITQKLPDGRQGPLPLENADGVHVGAVPLPAAARTLPILGPDARLTLRVLDRTSVHDAAVEKV
jgi:pimeloyl-ACP methyl ester carboxylesterase